MMVETPVKDTAQNPAALRQPLNRLMWWVFFVAATALLSASIETFKTFTLSPGWQNGLVFAATLGLLAVVMVILAYDSYIKEKAKSGVRKPVRLFEWFYRIQQEGANR